MATLSELVQAAISRLSMVPGIGVQLYSEDRIAEMIWHKFVIVRDELWWDDFMDYAVLTQDAAGRPTEPVTRTPPAIPSPSQIVINKYSDIQFAWSPSLRDPLREMPLRSNPMGMLKEGKTLWRTPDHDKVIRFAAFTPGQQMLVRYKRHYERFSASTVVPMDDQVLLLGAVYDYLEDDGTNPGQTEKFRNMFNDRLKQLRTDENDRDIQLSPAPFNSSNGWQTIA